MQSFPLLRVKNIYSEFECLLIGRCSLQAVLAKVHSLRFAVLVAVYSAIWTALTRCSIRVCGSLSGSWPEVLNKWCLPCSGERHSLVKRALRYALRLNCGKGIVVRKLAFYRFSSNNDYVVWPDVFETQNLQIHIRHKLNGE